MNDQLNTILKTELPIKIAAHFNIEWTNLHPFDIGHGHTAHLARNIILMLFGYPPVTCNAEGRSVDEYAQAITQETIQIQKDHAADLKIMIGSIKSYWHGMHLN